MSYPSVRSPPPLGLTQLEPYKADGAYSADSISAAHALSRETELRVEAERRADGLVEAWNHVSSEFEAAKSALEQQLTSERGSTEKVTNCN